MFTIDPETCKVLKEISTLVKSERVTVEAKKDVVSFYAINNNTLTQFQHTVEAKVEKPVVFAVEVTRLVHLLNRKDLVTISLEGARLDYKAGRSKGSLETYTADALPMDEPKSDKALTGLIRNHLKDIVIKSVVDGTELTLSIEEGPSTKICIVDSGAYHATAVIKDTPKAGESSLNIPLHQIQAAMRVFKDDIKTAIDAEYFYCFSGDRATAVRFRNTNAVPAIQAGQITDIVNSKSAIKFKADASIFDGIIADYKMIAEKAKGGKVLVRIEGSDLTFSAQTKHGDSSSTHKIKTTNDQTFTFELSVLLLSDLLRLKGQVSFSVKQSLNVLSMHQKNNDADLYYMCTIDKGEGFSG